jgi:formylglycine-generating enzyme required for sulfatase activity
MDALYVKDEPPVKYERNSFRYYYSLPQLLDTIQERQLRAAINKINSDFPKQPLKINDCVYFDAFAKAKQAYANNGTNTYFQHPYPRSLRFSTDRSKNYIDSLFSIHFFPKVPLEQYAQPFYFKKTEVTNAEYREFVNYVRDSVARRILAKNGFEDDYLLSEEQLIRKGWAFDSIDTIDKEYWPLNMKTKVYWNETGEDYKWALKEIYLPQEQRFWHRKEIDTRKLNYVYFTNEHNERQKHEINIYPDTLCWIHDGLFIGADAMTNHYFSFFDDHPVVGISFDQAKAFLHWKTKTEQQKLDAKGEKYLVEYALPTEIEWEIAATSEKAGDKISSFTSHFPALADFSWVTDLIVDSIWDVKEKVKVIVDTTVIEMFVLVNPGANTNEYLHHDDSTYLQDGKWHRRTITWFYWSRVRESYMNDNPLSGYSHPLFDEKPTPAPADLEKVPAIEKRNYKHKSEHGKKIKGTLYKDNSVILSQLDKNGISFMGGNVSEWIDQDYSDWQPAFEMRLKLLRSIDKPDAGMEYQREFYYNTFNDKNGKLVRGANWFDERYGNFLDKNPAGTNAKTFVDPKKTRCTIGFRYVVWVKRK